MSTTGAEWGRTHNELAIRLKTLPMVVVATDAPWPAASVMVAEAETDGLAWLVAVSVTVTGSVTLAGAVYKPAALMLPVPAGLIDQVTEALAAFPTDARNCCVPPPKTVETAGVTPIVTGGYSVRIADENWLPWLALTVTLSGAVMAEGAV